MSPLALKLIQVGFLVLLWVMVLSVAAVMRSDLFARRRARAGRAGQASRAERKAATAGADRAPKPSRPPKPKRGAVRELVVTSGTGEGTRIELGASPVTIGRAPENTLVLDDDYVSGRHARLFPHEGAWVVEDLGSTNGTYLGRARLSSPMMVPVGAQVRIGRTVIELRK